MYISTKAQSWFFDLMIAVILITGAVLFYIKGTTNIGDSDLRDLEEVAFEADKISLSLLSQGSPANWDNVTVERIGITDGNHVLDKTKLANFYSLDYRQTRALFGTRFDYYVLFANSSGSVLLFGECGYGSSDVIISNISSEECEKFNATLLDPDKLVKKQRILVNNNHLINMLVYTWD